MHLPVIRGAATVAITAPPVKGEKLESFVLLFEEAHFILLSTSTENSQTSHSSNGTASGSGNNPPGSIRS